MSPTCMDCTKQKSKATRQRWANKYPDRHKRAYTRANWAGSGVVFTDDETFEYWYSRYEKATHCEVTGIVFDSSSKMHCKCLDHDHKTGKPRGIICGKVNLVLGKLDDDVQTFEQILQYLRTD